MEAAESALSILNKTYPEKFGCTVNLENTTLDASHAYMQIGEGPSSVIVDATTGLICPGNRTDLLMLQHRIKLPDNTFKNIYTHLHTKENFQNKNNNNQLSFSRTKDKKPVILIHHLLPQRNYVSRAK